MENPRELRKAGSARAQQLTHRARDSWIWILLRVELLIHVSDVVQSVTQMLHMKRIDFFPSQLETPFFPCAETNLSGFFFVSH